MSNELSEQGTAILARCPDCNEVGGCILGIRSAFRIEKDGCPATGICRTKLYEVTSPRPENHYTPPVLAYNVKDPGAKSGVRVVNGTSFCSFIRRQKIGQGKKGKSKLRPSQPHKATAAPLSSEASRVPAPPTPTPPAPMPTEPPAFLAESNPPPPPPPPPEDGINPSLEAGV